MFQKILIIANLVIALGGLGIVYYSHFMLKPEATDQVAEVESMKQSALESTMVQTIPMPKIVVNLHSRNTRLRYLNVEMNILPFADNQKEIIKGSEHLIKDVVIEITSYLEPEELESITGKMLLENKIKKKINEKIGYPVVKQIFFSSFTVQ